MMSGSESYSYTNNIKNTSEMGISSSGDLQTIGNDITGMTSYVDLLITGGGKASKTGQPLGNKYFMNTKTTCVDINDTSTQVDRYIYINNVPGGALGGLVPGILSNMENISVTSPEAIYSAFKQYGGIPCQQVTLETIDTNNNVSSETQYLSTLDIKAMNPCWFPDGNNPITNEGCQDSFRGSRRVQKPKNSLVQLFFAFVGCLFVFCMYKMVLRIADRKKG